MAALACLGVEEPYTVLQLLSGKQDVHPLQNQLPAGLALLSLVFQRLPSATTGCWQKWSGPSDPLPLLVFDRSFSLCQNSAYLFRVSLTMMLPPSLGCPLSLKTPKMENPG